MYMPSAPHTLFSRKQTKQTIDCKKLTEIRGFEYSPTMMVKDFVKQFHHIGFQASNLSQGVEVIQEMVEDKSEIFLSIGKNTLATGLRDMIAQLVRDKKISCIIAPAALIEEDIMKTFSPFKLGEYDTSDEETAANKITRIGNVFIADEHYLKFEAWHADFMETVHKENKSWSIPEYVKRMGAKLKDENSIVYWAAKRNATIILTDILESEMEKHWNTFNADKKNGEKLSINVTSSTTALSQQLVAAKSKAGIILGSDAKTSVLVKESLAHGGLDYAVFVNAHGPLNDATLASRTKETALWNMLKNKKNVVHVECESTIALPLLMTGFYA
jgi:deoxyhypusine synthase